MEKMKDRHPRVRALGAIVAITDAIGAEGMRCRNRSGGRAAKTSPGTRSASLTPRRAIFGRHLRRHPAESGFVAGPLFHWQSPPCAGESRPSKRIVLDRLAGLRDAGLFLLDSRTINQEYKVLFPH